MIKSKEHSYRGPRDVGQITMDSADVGDYAALRQIGISLDQMPAIAAALGFGMDDQQGGLTSASIGVPTQFLQNFLPGFVRVLTAARKIDELVGITNVGSWEDEEIVQGMIEPIGQAVPYGDYTNVPLASWNPVFERRTVVRFEKGFKVGKLEEARAARIRLDSAAEKRAAAALALDIQRNAVGFFGFNNGINRTYGFLNDPSLPAYVTVASNAGNTSTTWANKSFTEIAADIRGAFALLQTQTQDSVSMQSKMTLVIPTNSAAYMSVISPLGYSVVEWVSKTFPGLRIVSTPQLNGANGGLNVFYLYAESVEDGASDNSRVWDQIVPAQMYTLGVENQTKAYLEDYSNATAGVLLKRPYAVVRFSGN